jgi:hypothetical protein
VRVKLPAACLATVLFLCIAVPTAAQTDKRTTKAQDAALERAVKRCNENRGVDCDSRQGLREWLREERAITEEERRAAAGARRQREQCAKTKNAAAGC